MPGWLQDPIFSSSIALLALGFLAWLRVRLTGRRAEAVLRLLARAEVTAVVTMALVLVLLGSLQIAMRNVFHRGIVWIEPLMRHLVLWIGFLGAALASARMKHINIDVFSRLLHGKSRKARDRVVYLATSFACSLLGVSCLRLVIEERSFGEESFLGLETWMLQLVLPLTFFLICYRSMTAFFGSSHRSTSGDPPVPED